MKIPKLTAAVFALAAAAALAFGQTSTDPNATGSGTGKYRITLVSPNEGASMPADQVRVVLTPNTMAAPDEKMQIDVFLDGQQKGVIHPNEAEFRVDGVTPGSHKLVLIARNPVTDQRFDRREISFVATGDGSTNVTSSTSRANVGDSLAGAHVPPAVNSTERQHSYTATGPSGSSSDLSASSSTSSSSSSSSYNPSSSSSSYNPSSRAYSSSPSTSAPSSNQPASSSTYGSSTTAGQSTATTRTDETRGAGGADRNELPATATNDAFLALAGVALLAAAGVLLRRGAA